MTIILTFQSTHHVLKSEKILMEAGFRFDIIPTPKNISSDCGMAIRFDDQFVSKSLLTELIKNNHIIFEIHEIATI